MIRRPPRSTRTDTLFPYTTRFRSEGHVIVIALRDILAAKAPVDAVIGAEQVEHSGNMGGAAVGKCKRLHRQVPQQHLIVRGGDEIMGRGRSELGEGDRLDGIVMAGEGTDRKSVGEGKSVSVRVDLGGRRLIKKKK